jgi:hypothetical protein
MKVIQTTETFLFRHAFLLLIVTPDQIGITEHAVLILCSAYSGAG